LCIAADSAYADTQSAPTREPHPGRVAEKLSDREQALRGLPLPYSLALRLRDAGVAADVICEYLNVEQVSLEGIYRLAAAKLRDAQNVSSGDAG
jgi:hypothetical protein